MIIQCEQCNVKYRLDESRIPAKRAKVRCSRCQHVFLVSQENQFHRETSIPLSLDEVPKESAQDPFQCPQCGFQQPHSEECIKCGIIFSKYKPRSEMPPSPYHRDAGGFGLDQNLIDEQAEPIPMMYAGFWRRFAAIFIDGIILGLLISLPIYIFSRNQQLARNATSLAWALYSIFMWGIWGASLGKMAMRIKIVGTNGSNISYGTAFLRCIGTIISSIPLYLGYLWMLWDGRKQTWHDKIASTCVIRTQ